MIEEAVDKNLAVIGSIQRQPFVLVSIFFLFVFFCVTRPWCICWIAAVVRCQFPAHLWIGFFVSFLGLSHRPPFSFAPCPYTLVSRLWVYFLFLHFPVTILQRRHPSKLYAYLLWALTARFGLYVKPQQSSNCFRSPSLLLLLSNHIVAILWPLSIRLLLGPTISPKGP